MPLRQAVSLLVADRDCGLDEDQVERLLSEYRSFNLANHDGMIRRFPGARRAVVELKARGYLIGVVSSNGRELGRRGLELCALDSLLDVAVFLEDTHYHKPRPEPVLKALERLDARPVLAAYVGDSRHDLIAGRRAGVQTSQRCGGPVREKSWSRSILISVPSR